MVVRDTHYTSATAMRRICFAYATHVLYMPRGVAEVSDAYAVHMLYICQVYAKHMLLMKVGRNRTSTLV